MKRQGEDRFLWTSAEVLPTGQGRQAREGDRANLSMI